MINLKKQNKINLKKSLKVSKNYSKQLNKKFNLKKIGGYNMKLMENKSALVFTNYIGRYTTRIFIHPYGDVYCCNGTELDLEGKKILLKLKCDGYKIIFE